MVGEKFGRLTVVGYAGLSGSGKRTWDCVCECGNHTVVTTSDLRNGHTKSCGCIRKEELIIRSTSHGKVHTRLYSIWTGMKNRCYNRKQDNFKYYGGRGIKVCNEWRDDFESFFEWAIANGYQDGYTIDRIDVNKDYSPENCAWKTQREQNLNTRKNRCIEYLGTTKTIKEWADECGLEYSCLLWRLNSGWDIARALSTPSCRERRQ